MRTASLGRFQTIDKSSHTGPFGPKLTFDYGAANARKEPKASNAAAGTNDPGVNKAAMQPNI